ncbi:MAG: histidinol dehydrogenase [Armatimonadetes bacterium]|nr:histidinol dehydrogenase [Armatimonadota bacterium]
MLYFDLRDPAQESALRAAFAARVSSAHDAEGEATVRAILDAVRTEGDPAVIRYTRRFDCAEAVALRVPASAITDAANRVREMPLWDALQVAAGRIRSFHERGKRESWLTLDTPGETLGQMVRPLSRVGVYVPGGTAAYPSTVLMATIPAQVAGVPSIALATPPGKNGLPPDATLAAAQIAGVSEVYAMGGAQAVAALAFGTESVASVVKIVGPGNRFVNLAKRLLFGTVGIDMLAGPSEVGVLCDDTANVVSIATEIIAQTEHDPLNSALVVSTSQAIADALPAEIERQLSDLPRAEVVRAALTKFGYLVFAPDLPDAIAVINDYAPEHLHVYLHDPWRAVPMIENAGAILIGEASTAALGDYVAGPCHTLPTAGNARFSSPLHVDDFQKKTSIIALGSAVAAELAPAALSIATFEGLEAHARSARHVLMNAK